MGKAVLGLAKVAFIKRWPSYRVATIDRFHYMYTYINVSLLHPFLLSLQFYPSLTPTALDVAGAPEHAVAVAIYDILVDSCAMNLVCWWILSRASQPLCRQCTNITFKMSCHCHDTIHIFNGRATCYLLHANAYFQSHLCASYSILCIIILRRRVRERLRQRK